ncbi:MAG: transposase [Verrucomicrobiales bacterium]
MRKTRRFQLGMDRSDGRPASGSRCVHVVSRTAGQEILFGDSDKETFHKILFKQLKFSGLRVIAWCFMGNHFHLLLEIPDRQRSLDALGVEDLLSRLSVFSGEMSTKFLQDEIELRRRLEDEDGLRQIAERVSKRLFDLSMFMKELKLRMTLAFNYAHGRTGTLWEGRFKCVLVEEGDALRAVAAYIDLNPVRAGIVKQPESYRWCSYAAAMGGMRLARAGLVSAISYERKIPWKVAVERYRKFIYGIGHEVRCGTTPDGHQKSKGGFSQREIEAVWESGGKISLAQALRCRVRYFSDGVVLGSQAFVDEFFQSQRAGFGAKRTSGGRRMKGADWGELRALRNLRDGTIRLPGARPPDR